MHLNRWTPDFDPEVDILSTVPIWVCLPHLPFHCWGDDVLKSIGDAIGKYIDKEESKPPMFSSAQICVEVDLEIGIP
jgi:hypothetical protein